MDLTGLPPTSLRGVVDDAGARKLGAYLVVYTNVCLVHHLLLSLPTHSVATAAGAVIAG